MKDPKIHRLQQFVRFKKSQSFSSTTTAPPKTGNTQQQMQYLIHLQQKNNDKQNQLMLYQKQYQKLNKHVKQVLYQLKNQQDAVDSQLQNLETIRKSQSKTASDQSLKISQMREQLDHIRQQIQKQKQLSLIKSIQNKERIQKEKQLIRNLQQKISEHQDWLVASQNNSTARQNPLDLKSIISESQQLRKSNQILIKQIAGQMKRFKKECEQVKKIVRQQTDKLEQKLKSWMKKCESVLDGKKQLGQIIPQNYNKEILQQYSLESVQIQYSRQLQTIGSLYSPELKKQLGDLLQVYKLKTQSNLSTYRNSFEKYNLTQLQQQLTKLQIQSKNKQDQVRIRQDQIQMLSICIQKYDKQINQTKSAIQIKKRK